MKKNLLIFLIVLVPNYTLASETESLSDTESTTSQQIDAELEFDTPMNIISKLVDLAQDEHEERLFLEYELEEQKKSNKIWKIATTISTVIGVGCILLVKFILSRS